MSYVVAIREYKYNDAPLVNELVKNGYLSNVNGAWCTALFKELVVMTAAIMFIFVGVPFFYCLSAVPVVMLIIYVAVYLSFYAKATELVTARKPLKCWVAEVYLPFFFTKDPQQFSFRIVSNERTEPGSSDLGTYQKKIVGTVSVMNHSHSPSSAWLFRLVVDDKFRKKGIGRALVKTVQSFCRGNGYADVQLAISECQEDARRVFSDCNFQLRLMYHKQLMGTLLTLLMYHMESDLGPHP